MRMKPVVEMNRITKRFGGVTALDGVNLTLYEGEIHFLLGENGAGKSTLIKTLMGIVQPDEGEIHLAGQRVRIATPHQARKSGINAVFQELSLTPSLPVWQNIFLGWEQTQRTFLQKKQMQLKAAQLLQPFRIDFSENDLCENLSIANQQIVEIAKAFVTKPKVLILDEATSSLYKEQVDLLLESLLELKRQGTTILYITHRLAEAYQVVDRVTILRDGKNVIEAHKSELSYDDAIQLMSGKAVATKAVATKTVAESPERLDVSQSEVQLKVTSLTNRRSVGLDFAVHRGEILGIAGLQGHGQQELLYSLYGEEPYHGQIELNGQVVNPKHPSRALKQGIALISGDRKAKSIFLPASLRYNIGISSLARRAKWGFLNTEKDKREAVRMGQRLQVNTQNYELAAGSLSGGNQQKLVVARVLLTDPKVILLDDPTRGIDIGTKNEFHKLLFELAETGVSIVVVSSDTEELVAISHRVLVMRNGQFVAEIPRAQLSADRVVGEAFER